MNTNLHIITGNKGFVGINLITYLKNKGKNTIGVSRTPVLEELSYDTLNIEKLNQSKSLIHLAGKAHDLKKTSEDKEYFEVNTVLTKSLFDQFLQSDCEVFIYMSSVKAAADEVAGVLTETVTPNPVTVYGKSKLAAENYILSKEIPTNKRVYILRPCMIHGPGNKGNLNTLYQLVSKGLPWPLGDFKNKRSFLSIENLCFVIKELLDNPTIPSGIYNVADDQALSTNDLILLIGQSLGLKSKIWHISTPFIKSITKLGDYLHLPLNTERLQKLTENYVVSNAKIMKAIGKPLPVSVTEGLLRTFESFKNKNKQ